MLQSIKLLFFSLVLVACQGSGSGELTSNWGFGDSENSNSSSSDSSDNPSGGNSESGPNAPTSLNLSYPASATSFVKNPVVSVGGVSSGDVVRVYSDASCTNQTGSATASGTSIDITNATLSAGSYTFYASRSNGSGSSECSSISVSYTVIACPSGYIPVPADTNLGVSEFCVMQFEAKNDGRGNAISQAASDPWTSISQSSAKSACTGIGTGYDLISNPEWLAIARDVETMPSNWTGGAVGSGCLLRGNIGGTNDCSGVASGYDGPVYDSGSSRDSTASLFLSNREQIWDLSGNVLEWVDWTLGGVLSLGPTSCSSGTQQIPLVSCGALAANDYMPDNPGGITANRYNSDYGLGVFIGGSNGGAIRSGGSAHGSLAGVFRLDLSYSGDSSFGVVGFRCVYRR